ncbi:MAG: zinc-ribbon domain containing protein, partial [Candidatus Gracilibacteria bacterium]
MEKIILSKKCKNCQNNFDITNLDIAFYEKIKVPQPTLCPDCRQQRRLAQVNQLNLFKRKCPMTNKDIVSNYPPDGPYTVYEQHYWWSDEVNNLTYGRDFNFNRPFFEQYKELSDVVPRRPLFADYPRDVNSTYTNYAGKNKDCYMLFDSDEDHDCMYSYGMNGSRSSMDCYRVQNLELCYETVDSKDCYNCHFTHNSQSCSDSYFLNNCIGCRHCIYCSNLKQKEYYIFNEPTTKEQYENIIKSFGSYSFLMDKIDKFREFRLQFPNKFLKGFQ